MSNLAPGPGGSGLIERVKNILLTPKAEWPRIDAEPATVADFYKSHVIPLAAIGPVATLIGGQAFGHGTIVGDRVMVQAEGHAASIDVLKAAVAGVDLAKVEGLAKQ
jgi:hypothetical protein